MRRILAFSIAAVIPAMLPAGPAGAHTRPAPPSIGAHDRPTAAQRIGAHLDPAPPPGSAVHHASVPSAVPSTRPAVAPSTAPASGPAAAPPRPGSSAASPAGANPSGDRAGRQIQTQLVLKKAVGSETPRTVTLQCDPVGGTHPKAAQACADLARSHGNFTLEPSAQKPQACFMIYSPVTVSAEGRWNGDDYQFQVRYPNTCAMKAETGSIFEF